MAIAVDDPALRASARLRRKAVNRAFATFAWVSGAVTRMRATQGAVEILRDIAYGPHRYNRLDIYRPRYAARPLPVLLYIHGGAFTLCSKDTHRGIARHYAERSGYLVFNIDYRLAPRFRYPAAHEDACHAYAWVAEHCAQYGGDPQRIVVAGESAGGNLALAVAVAASYRRPEPWAKKAYHAKGQLIGVKPLMPYLQVSNPGRQRYNPAAGWLAVSVAHEISAAYLGPQGGHAAGHTLMADPVRVLEECGAPQRDFPPVFSGVGTVDLCCEDVQRLERACRKHGISVQTHYYPGEIHAFHVLRWRENAQHYWARCFEFMARVVDVAEATRKARALRA